MGTAPAVGEADVEDGRQPIVGFATQSGGLVHLEDDAAGVVLVGGVGHVDDGRQITTAETPDPASAQVEREVVAPSIGVSSADLKRRKLQRCPRPAGVPAQ